MRRPATLLLALVVGVGLSAPRAGHAESGSASRADPYDAYARSLQEAIDAVTQGRLGGAVQAYAAAYDALPANDRVGALGDDVVIAVVDLCEQSDFVNTAELRELQTAEALIERYVQDAVSLDAAAVLPSHRAALEALRLAIEEHEHASEAPPELNPPKLPPPAEPERDAAPREAPDEPKPRVRRLGLGLTIGGAGLTAVGVGLLAYGASFNALNNRLASVYERDEANGTLRGDDLATANAFIAEEQRQANAWLAVGGVAAGVGAGLIVAGVVVLYRHRRPSNSARMVPILGPNRSGMAVVRRF